MHALHPAAQATKQCNGTDDCAGLYNYCYSALPVQFPNDESRNVPPSQLSAVHTLGDAPRRDSESLQVKQCAGLAGLEQVAQVSSHPV